MAGDDGAIDQRFAAFVRDRGQHHLRVAVLLTGDWHAAEDLVQASLAKLYRAWPRPPALTWPTATPPVTRCGGPWPPCPASSEPCSCCATSKT
jgi:hypothetical protein